MDDDTYFIPIICPLHSWLASSFWYFGFFVYSGYVETSLSDITSWMIFLTLSNPPDLLSWVYNTFLSRLHTFCYHSLILHWTFQFSVHTASFPYLKPLITTHAHAYTQTKDAIQFIHVTDHVFSMCPHDIPYINPWSHRSSGMCAQSRFVVASRWLIPTPNQRHATSQRSDVFTQTMAEACNHTQILWRALY